MLDIFLSHKHEREIKFLINSAFGIGDLEHGEPIDRKSISVGRTFGMAFNFEEICDIID